MEKSDSIKEIGKALCKFQSEVPKIDLNKTVKVTTKAGGSYNFKYATFANGIDTIKKQLTENNLSYSQIIESDGSVTTLLIHESGEYLQGNLLLKTSENNAQAVGSMITYAKRYSLFSILGIVAEEDDDANGSMGNHMETTTEKENTFQSDQKTDYSNKPKVETWLKESEFNTLVNLLKSPEKEKIDKGISNYKGFLTPPFGMKKDYKTVLEKMVSDIEKKRIENAKFDN